MSHKNNDIDGITRYQEDKTMKHKTNQRNEMQDRFNEDNLNDVSLYGEFVSTFHQWTSSEDLHAKGAYLQSITETK